MHTIRRAAIVVTVGILLGSLADRAPAQGSLQGTRPSDEDDLLRLSRLATATERPLERLPSTVKILSGDDIRRSGARFLPDALRMLPGVEVMRLSASESSISMRGYHTETLGSQGVLGLVDGRQVYNPFIGGTLWDAIQVDMAELERVEVLLGPGSFVYGPNAMHGIVNIVTKSPLDYDADFVSVGAAAGSYGSTLGRLVAVRREGSTALKASFVWDDIDQFQPRGDNTKDKGFAEVRFEALLDEDDPLHRFDITVNRSRHETETHIQTLAATVPDSTYTNDIDEVFVRAEYQNHGLRARASWDGFEDETAADRIFPPTTIDLDTLESNLQYTAEPWAQHRMTIGAGVRYSTFDTSDLDLSDGRQDATVTWVFLQDELELSESWFLTTGLRYDYHSVVGSNVAPRAALVWEFDQHTVEGERMRTQSLRASYGQGFRFPSLRELFINMVLDLGPVTLPFVGNEDLDPEQLQSFELAYNGTFGENRLGLTGYYNRVDDLVAFTATVPATYTNAGDEEVFGFEIDGEHHFNDWLTGFGNYSHTNRQARSSPSDLEKEPRHKFNLGLRAHVPSHPAEDPSLGLHATLWFHYFDDTEQADLPVDSYELLNAYVGYDFLMGRARDTKGSVFVQAFNLLDNDHREHPEGDKYGIILMAGFSVSW